MYKITLVLITGLTAVMPMLAGAGDCGAVENNNLAIYAGLRFGF